MKTEVEVKEIVEKYLTQKNRKFVYIESPDKITYKANNEVLHGKKKGEYLDVFVVGYDFMVVNQQRGAIIYIDAETGEVLYSLSSHGWVEELED